MKKKNERWLCLGFCFLSTYPMKKKIIYKIKKKKKNEEMKINRRDCENLENENSSAKTRKNKIKLKCLISYRN